jgi:hypothetical protein
MIRVHSKRDLTKILNSAGAESRRNRNTGTIIANVRTNASMLLLPPREMAVIAGFT